MMGWIFIVRSGFDGPHWKIGEKQSGKKLVSPFLAWLTPQLAASNSFWEEAQVPLLLLSAQVYDNPNKLWCAAQTLKTLIGTKSNRLCLSGQESWESDCVCSSLCSLPTINFSLSSNPTLLQVHLPISASLLSFCLLLPFGSTCNFPFPCCALSIPHLPLKLTW